MADATQKAKKPARAAGIWSSRKVMKDTSSSTALDESPAAAKKLSSEELEMLAAEKEVRENMRQRERWRKAAASAMAVAAAEAAAAKLDKLLIESSPEKKASLAAALAAKTGVGVVKAPIRREAPLRKPKVIVRVRPLAQSGGHSNEGEPVSKRLASWANGAVVLEDEIGTDHGSVTGIRSQTYTFAQEVLGPDAQQEAVNRAAAADLVKAVCTDGFNGLLFAYGQTGARAQSPASPEPLLSSPRSLPPPHAIFPRYIPTRVLRTTGTGKTHTIFGPQQSWRSIGHEDAGVLPRALAAMLDTITSKADSTSAILTASAMEFYMSSCLDLLEEGVVDGANGSVSSSDGAAGGASGGGGTAACHIGSDHTPIGLMSVPIDSEQACLAFMSRVRERRHTRATLMNAASDGHHGSSRSHCTTILTLRQLDRASGAVRTTKLHIIVCRL